MANTNTNTTVETSVLSTDIYDISAFIDQIRRNNIPDISDTAAIVGIFGYMNEIFGQTLQNSLIAISETSNEALPTRAKFSKNVIAHALNYGISKITAEPAVMSLMFNLPTSYIESNFTELDTSVGKFILDKDVPIFIDNYEYHLDYDIIITRTLVNDKYVYTPMYDLFVKGTTKVKRQNTISDINNPYITGYIVREIDGVEYFSFAARVHQVSVQEIKKTILTNNDIENKTVTFEFEDQLASFDVDVIEGDKTTHLTPVYSGLIDFTTDSNYCNYEYLDENTIRIIFNRDSYVPGMNAEVVITVKRTEGAGGNFTYNNSFKTALKSEKYNNYNGMYMIINPLLEGQSSNGKDKKSIAVLRKIIPREISSRGAVINTVDLQNFFNSINDEQCKLYFSKKRDNPFERLYYAHMLMRKDSNVYPTNTVNLKITQDDFNGDAVTNNLSITPGTTFYYYDSGDSNYDFSSVLPPVYNRRKNEDEELYYDTTINSKGEEVRVFEYISPFLITIDDDLISSYLLTIMKENKILLFDDINMESNLQFIATNMDWSRKYIYRDENGKEKVYDNKYVANISVLQNNSSEYNLVQYHYDGDGNMVFDEYEDGTKKIKVKVYMVLYSDDKCNTPYRYIEGELVEYDPAAYIYNFRFILETDDLMDLNNRINIKGVYNAKPEMFQKKESKPNSHGYLNSNTYCKLFIMADFGIRVGDKVDGVEVTQDYIDGLEDKGITLYPNSESINPGNRDFIESIIPTRNDIVNQFLKNEIYLEKEDKSLNVVNIIKANKDYLDIVKEYNNDDQETQKAILHYIRNNKNSDFVQNVLLKDPDVIEVIESYNYEDISRYTVCNVMDVDGGVYFYHDYSNMMTSVVEVAQVQRTDDNGNPLYKEIDRTDSLGNNYKEMIPIYKVNSDNTYYYNYTINRIPMIKKNFLNTEEKMEEFIYDLEERRRYINICLSVLEDTFGIDLKFFNTFGPSRKFYYDIPSSTSYKVKVGVDVTKVFKEPNENDTSEYNIIGSLKYGEELNIIKVKGQWGYIEFPMNGWIKLTDTVKCINYIDNVSLTMKYALEAQTSADKYISNNIIRDVKDYIEDINEVTELHIPNVITLITNSYREQLVYFEFLDVNKYGAACQHLYMDESKVNNVDICPEFLNIEIDDETEEPKIDITVY